jgi:hypothetical protein
MMIKPAIPGAVVRDPRNLRKDVRIPDDGIEVPDDDLHWAQRLRDGDVVRVGDTVRVAGPQAAIPPLTTR